MAKCTIDGKEVEFTPGQNMIEAAKNAGIEIPFFCYHPGLSVVAQCRMCAIEIEKMPKLQTACSTPLTKGMVVHTQSERVKQNQKSVMEFLLINHPLDCPICDKAGECDLQDNSFKFGEDTMRTSEDRRTYVDLDMGPVIQKNMNRCIHCTRCIRFGDEIAGIREMVAISRGNHTEITTLNGLPLETEYAGNYADICPTGSLTLKDFRFKKRAWFLKKTETVCEGCSRGCNIELQQDNNVIHRCIARTNMEINRHWICDEGRFNYHHLQSENRMIQPCVDGKHVQDWSTVVDQARKLLAGKKLTLLVGTDLTQEELELIRAFKLSGTTVESILHFGTPGVESIQQDGPADQLLKRKSKTANLFGAEKLGIQPMSESALEKAEAILVIRGGKAIVPESLKGHGNKKPVIGMGVFNREDLAGFSVVMPGLSFAEKNGTIYNFEGKEQRFKQALAPLGRSKPLAEIFMLMIHSKEVVA
jgi:NADH-quinone oxidoreductase subunit G